MATGRRRRFSAAEKYQILLEGRLVGASPRPDRGPAPDQIGGQPPTRSGASVAEVCRRHQIAASQYYDWERLAKEGALTALAQGKRKLAVAPQDMSAEVARLREVVVELSAENLAWKKGRY